MSDDFEACLMEGIEGLDEANLEKSGTPLADMISFCDTKDQGKTRTLTDLLCGNVLYLREMLHAPRKPDGTYDLVAMSTQDYTIKTCDVIEAIKLSSPVCKDVALRLECNDTVKHVVVGRFVDGIAKIPAFNMLAAHHTSVSLVLDEDVSVSVLAGQLAFDLRALASKFVREGRFVFNDGEVSPRGSRL
jgi:hypothetical protein